MAEVAAGVQAQQPDAEDEGRDHRRAHDAAVQLALHDHEALAAGRVLAHGVVNEQAWQIKQAGKPADDADDMKGFEP
ncbi:hypothetical protein D9M73_189360 [compost metagenome]